MKWLTDLIENNTSSLEMLPVPCLCELFMIQCHGDGSRDPDDNTEQQAAHRMHYKRKKTTNEKVVFCNAITTGHISCASMCPRGRQCSIVTLSFLYVRMYNLSVAYVVCVVQFQQRHQQLLDRLKELVLGGGAEMTSCIAVLGHLMQKLTNSHLQPRKMAIKVCVCVVCV